MRFAPKLVEVKALRSDVSNCFVACDLDGKYTAFAIINKTRFEMGSTVRPIEHNGWTIEFLASNDVDLQDAKSPGGIISVRRTNYVLVSLGGCVVEGSAESYVETLKLHQRGKAENKEVDDLIAKQRLQSQERKWRQEKASKEAERQRLGRVKEQATQVTMYLPSLTRKIMERDKRLKEDQRNLVLFPSLSNFQSVLDHELQTQLKLLGLINASAHIGKDIDRLSSELRRASDSENTHLKPLRDQIPLLIQQEKARQRELAIAQAHREKEAQIAQTTSGDGCVVLVVALGISLILVSKFAILLFHSMATLIEAFR